MRAIEHDFEIREVFLCILIVFVCLVGPSSIEIDEVKKSMDAYGAKDLVKEIEPKVKWTRFADDELQKKVLDLQSKAKPVNR